MSFPTELFPDICIFPNLSLQGPKLPVSLPPPPSKRRVTTRQSSTPSFSPEKTTSVRQPSASDLAPQDKASAIPISPTSTSEKSIPNMAFDFETGEFSLADLAGFTWPDTQGAASPEDCSSGTATPHSTESEQSAALDPSQDQFDDFEFFELDKAAAIPLDSDLPSYQQAMVPDSNLAQDPTMLATFGSAFANFGDLTGLGPDATTQLGLTGLFAHSTVPAPSSSTLPVPQPGPEQFYESLFGAAPFTVEPSALISTPVTDAQVTPSGDSLKRKLSDDSSDCDSTAPAKRPRGRPPKSRTSDASLPKRPVQRLSKSSKLDTPGTVTMSLGPDSEPGSPKLTSSGKPSTARPRSVVPERYLRDGSAQKILGMDLDQIAKYPSFEDLLKDVEPSKKAQAAELGAKIADQRDKAADAAKKSRDERKAKIDTLESKVSDLTRLLRSIAARGALTSTETAMLVALSSED
ncbi:hypothetical protein BD324DRAFT_651029 [Kockovaella imperatae]|uniref:BZIP domain-containing protein n=1 Tax=Kockovaella imperatae TaxID=4999 RepID=A0A1Y1UIW8_9TREE|nr:hypothetical protein BD324DRAFT_651029 [Kockovaella imperatae]ORX37436.1 hypothetical protein BD324DRAFT_651029 [Kockovaella imperatae]